MKQFEYLNNYIGSSVEAIEASLNQQGKEGWELVQICGCYGIFKREMQEPIPQEVKEYNEKLDQPIPVNKLYFRAAEALRIMEAYTFRDLFSHRRSEFMRLRNFGKKSLSEIDNLVEEAGLEMYWYK
jgi:DNA-directed RNA polymerase alpha subunit